MGLSALPNEILFHVAFLLRTPDLQRLGRASSRFNDFVTDYMKKHRYSSGLVVLPNDIILEIARYLPDQTDCSQLAQTNHRFYPLLMNFICHVNVCDHGSSLLNFAAMRNQMGLIRQLVRAGADVNTRAAFRVRQKTWKTVPTPLAAAAFFGSSDVVDFLLQHGASQLIEGWRAALALAILRRREDVALTLSQGVDPGEVLSERMAKTAIQMACEAKLEALVRYYLEPALIGAEGTNRIEQIDLDMALIGLLQQDTSEDHFAEEDLHEDVYQIALLLLKCGVDPDSENIQKSSDQISARGLASRHPDPRVRDLFRSSKMSGSNDGGFKLVDRTTIEDMRH